MQILLEFFDLQSSIQLNGYLAAAAFNRAWLALTAVSEVEAMLLMLFCHWLSLHWPCAS